MGRKSSITGLPSEVRSYLESKLAENHLTLDELIADVQAKFPSQQLPSRSAVHRYGQKLDRKLEAIRASTQAAKIIQESFDDSKDARSEALTALIQTDLFDAILEFQEFVENNEALDPLTRMSELSKVSKNIATLNRSSIDLKKYKAEVEEQTRQKLLEEQKAKLDAVGKDKGVTEDTKRAIREALGIV